MNYATFVAALQEHGIPSTTVDGSPLVWVELDAELADPLAIHRAMTLAGASIRFEDWLDQTTTTADEHVRRWLERWDLA